MVDVNTPLYAHAPENIYGPIISIPLIGGVELMSYSGEKMCTRHW